MSILCQSQVDRMENSIDDCCPIEVGTLMVKSQYLFIDSETMSKFSTVEQFYSMIVVGRVSVLQSLFSK